MAGGALLYGVIGLLAGVILGDKIREMVQQSTGFEIPKVEYASAYDSYAYPSTVDYPSTTSSSLVGKSYERDYDNANELHINHINIE